MSTHVTDRPAPNIVSSQTWLCFSHSRSIINFFPTYKKGKEMLFRSIRTSGAIRSATRNIHSTSPRLDTATSAKNAAEGAGKQLSNLAERAKALGKPLADRATSMTGGE